MNTPSFKGVIALDIDGTITVDSQPVPDQVITYLDSLATEGWKLIFLTGRTFHRGYMGLQKLKSSYYLAVQNGAIILELPSQKILLKQYLDRSIFPFMEEICADEPSDFVIYSGYEHNDISYFRPQHFSKEMLTYIEERTKTFHEPWQQLPSYDSLHLHAFPSIKCFGDYASAIRITEKINKLLGLHVPMIRDPFNHNFYVIQATKNNATKGTSLKHLFRNNGERPLIIAAGDDYNDLGMFDVADIKIAMNRAPKEMLEKADMLGGHAETNGIITGLQKAIDISHQLQKSG